MYFFFIGFNKIQKSLSNIVQDEASPTTNPSSTENLEASTTIAPGKKKPIIR